MMKDKPTVPKDAFNIPTTGLETVATSGNYVEVLNAVRVALLTLINNGKTS